MNITVFNDGNSVTSFSRNGQLTNYVYEDGELRKLAPGMGYMDNQIKTLHISAYNNDYERRKMNVLICNEIGEGAAIALEGMGVSIYRNVSGSKDDALKALIDGKLQQGENTAKADVENLLDYALIIWNKKDCYEKGCERYSHSLSPENKVWLFDQLFNTDWMIFDKLLALIGVSFSFETAKRYMNGFLLEHPYCDGVRRKEDDISYQEHMVDRLKMLLDHLENGMEKSFIDESFIVAAKYRWIFVAEFLMDRGADIAYVNSNKESVAKYQRKMKDLTMADYLDYYRKSGKKKCSSREFFKQDEKRTWEMKYSPEFAIPKKKTSKKVFGKEAEKIARELLNDYDAPNLLDASTSSAVLSRFVDQYNWDDGLELPHFIAVHPKCSKTLKKKLYNLVEGNSFYGTKDFENSNDEQWKAFITELHDMLNGQ